MSTAVGQQLDSPSRATESYWRTRVPKHWEVPSNFALFHERIDRGGSEDEMLTVTIDRGILRQSDFLEGSSKKDSSNEDKSKYKRVKPGDLAYNKMRMWQGAVGYSAYEGIVSPAYIVLQPRRPINPRYFHYLFRTPDYTHLSAQHSHGICDDQNSLRFEDFKRIFSPLPPRPEQDAIVAYLDGKLESIDRYLRVKEREIALLEERKRALIHRAVTDEYVTEFPNDILCLPRPPVPKDDWRSYSVTRLLQLQWLSIQDGNHGELHPKASDYVEDGIPFLMANDVRPAGLNMETCAKITERQARSLRIGFAKPNDVLLTHKATIGQVGIVPQQIDHPFLMLTPQVTYYRSLTPQLLPEFLLLFMSSELFQQQLRVLSLNQSTRPYLGLIEQRNLVICFPSVSKQRELVEFASAESSQINTTITRARHQIERMQEYRTALIAEAVTGKVNVSQEV